MNIQRGAGRVSLVAGPSTLGGNVVQPSGSLNISIGFVGIAIAIAIFSCDMTFQT